MADGDPFVYPDLLVHEGDAICSYSEEGWKAKRIFFVNWADQTNPTETLYNVYQSLANPSPATPISLPQRQAPHPTIVIPNDWSAYMHSIDSDIPDNAFCVDLVTITAVTPVQIKYVCEYAIFNAEKQEASAAGDEAPALMTTGSSVQQGTTAVDIAGQPIAFCYDAGAGDVRDQGTYNIFGQVGGLINYVACQGGASVAGPNFGTFVPGVPAINSAANKQTPQTLFRFRRRETKPRSKQGFVSYMNSAPWTINGDIYPAATVFCTRIENETHDNGLSYIVLYEFQGAPPRPNAFPNSIPIFPAVYVDPAEFTLSPFDVGGYYSIVQGIGTPRSGLSPDFTGPLQVPAGQVPPDAAAFIFRVYNDVDFNTELKLTTV